MVATSLITAQKFLHMAEARGSFELIEGVVAAVSPTSGVHISVLAELNRALVFHLGAEPSAVVWTGEPGLYLERDPDTVVAPDLAVVTLAQHQSARSSKGFVRTIPRLVIEIKSPGDREPEIARKLAIYQRAGVPEIWWLRPDSRSLTVHWLDRDPLVVIAPATFTASTVLPGFTPDLGLVFA